MLTLLLRREGVRDNHKRIERIYQEAGLQVRRRRRRRRDFGGTTRVIRPVVLPDERWSADFIHDSVLDGRPFRCLAIVDHVTREPLAIEVGRSIGGVGVVDALERLKIGGRTPRDLQLDNGPEFRSFAVNRWCHENGVSLQFIQPGKPTQNAHIESFMSRFREECLNEHWFVDLEDARAKIETWRISYNERRPHTALKGATPKEMFEKLTEVGQIP
jgi:putative transposase